MHRPEHKAKGTVVKILFGKGTDYTLGGGVNQDRIQGVHMIPCQDHSPGGRNIVAAYDVGMVQQPEQGRKQKSQDPVCITGLFHSIILFHLYCKVNLRFCQGAHCKSQCAVL